MSDYTATGKPLTATRGVAADMRNEFSLIETAIATKANIASPTLSDPTLTGTAVAPTQTAGDSSTKIATTAFVAATAFASSLPAQTGNSGKILTTDGAAASWVDTLTGPLNEKHGADIASAGTIDLDAATGNLVDVTGTTTITAITLADGAERTVRFTGALTLTNGASLVLPGGANITTAAGDYAIFRGYTSSVVRCVHYGKASGASITPAIPGWVPISSVSASGASTMEFTSGIDSTYNTYKVIGNNIVPSVDGAGLYCRLYLGGAVYLGATYDYHIAKPNANAGTYTGIGSLAGTIVRLIEDVGTTSGECAGVEVTLHHPSSASLFKGVTWQGFGYDSAGYIAFNTGAGGPQVTTACDGIRIYPSSGTFSGEFSLYGVNI